MRRFKGDGRWLTVMTVLVALELGWWLIAWNKGFAPIPSPAPYALGAIAALAAALAIDRALRPGGGRPSWASILTGTALVVAGSSLFLPLKIAIPWQMPFWLDQPLARVEGAFGIQPWQMLDRLIGWATAPVDRIYALWLPVQSLILFTVIIATPSPAKSRALIAYGLAWFVLGVAGATLLSSAGPIFYDRLYGGSEFAGLGEVLHRHGAWVALTESEAMWTSFASRDPSLVAGISAVPSMHVAISLWILLAARQMAPRASGFALAYFVFIWIASVQLGWHYMLDGVAGALGMLAVWALSGPIDALLSRASTRLATRPASAP